MKHQAIERAPFVSPHMTPERIEAARRLAAKGVGCAPAARALGVSRHVLRRWSRTSGAVFEDGRRLFAAPRPKVLHMTPEVCAQARALAEAGRGMMQASRDLGVSFRALETWARRQGLTFQRPQHYGVMARMTPAEVETYSLAIRKHLLRDEALAVAGRPDLIGVFGRRPDAKLAGVAE
jgi:transposase-like protein